MRIEASYRVTTPLFLGGADNGKNAELRPPALKGLLRFWFRAVALPQLNTLPEVWKEERDLFGSTAGQAAFLLSVVDHSKFLPAVSSEGLWYNPGVAYLGYGMVEKDKKVRRYLKPGISFTVRLDVKRNLSDQGIIYLVQSLKALGLFGGAGARSRKGFGSLSLESLRLDGIEAWSQPTNKEELRERIRDFLADIRLDQASPTRPPYTAFSSEAKVYIVKTGEDALALLDEIGRELLRYRSYGREKEGRHVLPWSEEAEQNFAADHDLIKDYLNGQPIMRHPQRIVFGLPHNYFFGSTKQKATVTPKNFKRRASPLFIHIHALGPQNYAAVASLLPAAFLPEGEKIAIRCSGCKAGPVYVDCDVDYRVIEAFFDRPSFNSKVVVWP